MGFKPIGNKVLVSMDRREEIKGGIHIPQKAQEAPEFGEVHEVGTRVETLQKGDRVYVQKHLGTSVKSDGQYYVLIEETKIVGYTRKESPNEAG
jgi:co-chaperonin GroES (HSP10)